MLHFSITSWIKDDGLTPALRTKFEIATKLVNQEINNQENLYFDLVIVSPAQMQKLNQKFRKVDAPTDVLTFALRDAKDIHTPLLGEIYLCPKFFAEMPLKHGLDYELVLAFVHGILHLFGYSHHDKKNEKIMVNLQKKITEKVVC